MLLRLLVLDATEYDKLDYPAISYYATLTDSSIFSDYEILLKKYIRRDSFLGLILPLIIL